MNSGGGSMVPMGDAGKGKQKVQLGKAGVEGNNADGGRFRAVCNK